MVHICKPPSTDLRLTHEKSEASPERHNGTCAWKWPPAGAAIGDGIRTH
jgi:hypothetical protein